MVKVFVLEIFQLNDFLGSFNVPIRLELCTVTCYLYNIIVKEKPKTVTLHYCNVMTPVWSTEIIMNNSISLNIRK